MNADDALKALCRVAGFDPDDPVQWAWWRNLGEKDRNELAWAMDKGKIPLYGDRGIQDGGVADDTFRLETWEWNNATRADRKTRARPRR